MKLATHSLALVCLACLSSTPRSQISGSTQISSDPSYPVLAVGDVDDNGWTDIVSLRRMPGSTVVELRLLGAGGSVLTTIAFPAVPYTAAGFDLAPLGDLDRDGVPDFAFTLGADIEIWFLNDDGSLREKQLIPVDPQCAFSLSLIDVDDIDGDSVVDLVLWTGGVFIDSCIETVFLNTDGTVRSRQTTTPIPAPVSGTELTAVSPAGDLDGNGVVDAFWTYAEYQFNRFQQSFYGAIYLASDGTVLGGTRFDGPTTSDMGYDHAIPTWSAAHCRTAVRVGQTMRTLLPDGQVGSTFLDGQVVYESMAWIDDLQGDGCPDMVGGNDAGLHLIQVDCFTDIVPGTRLHNGGGTNRILFTETSPPDLGGTWTSHIDLAAAGGIASLVAVGLGGPSQGIPLGGFFQGELLCLPPFATPVDVSVSGQHALALPAELSYLGNTYCAQGASFSPGALELLNALEFVIACH